MEAEIHAMKKRHKAAIMLWMSGGPSTYRFRIRSRCGYEAMNSAVANTNSWYRFNVSRVGLAR